MRIDKENPDNEDIINGIKTDIFGFSALIENDEQCIRDYLKEYEWGF